jgi:hypothetical protein
MGADRGLSHPDPPLRHDLVHESGRARDPAVPWRGHRHPQAAAGTRRRCPAAARAGDPRASAGGRGGRTAGRRAAVPRLDRVRGRRRPEPDRAGEAGGSRQADRAGAGSRAGRGGDARPWGDPSRHQPRERRGLRRRCTLPGGLRTGRHRCPSSGPGSHFRPRPSGHSRTWRPSRRGGPPGR